MENLKQLREFGWVWLTRLKANRLVNPDRSGLRPVARVESDAHGTIVHLKSYGLIRLFQIVAPDGDREWWATNDLARAGLGRDGAAVTAGSRRGLLGLPDWVHHSGRSPE